MINWRVSAENKYFKMNVVASSYFILIQIKTRGFDESFQKRFWALKY